MKIYKDYTTLNLLFNEPCVIDDKCAIYPISVKEYEEFMKYAKYLLLSRKQLILGEKDNLLQTIILISVAEKCKGGLNLTDPQTIEAMNIVLEELCEMFSIITKEKIECKSSNEGGFYFIGKKTLINSDNYDSLREVIMKMTLLKEPKVFEDKLYEEMYYKAMKANRKEGASLEDILLTVIQDTKYTFDYVLKLNVVQLYGLYLRIAHVKNSDAITIYRTCSNTLPDVSFTDGVIDNLWKNDDDSDLFADLGDLSNKIK